MSTAKTPTGIIKCQIPTFRSDSCVSKYVKFVNFIYSYEVGVASN